MGRRCQHGLEDELFQQNAANGDRHFWFTKEKVLGYTSRVNIIRKAKGRKLPEDYKILNNPSLFLLATVENLAPIQIHNCMQDARTPELKILPTSI